MVKGFEALTGLNVAHSQHLLGRIFTADVLRSIVGYFTFWTCAVSFAISSFGLLYYRYIDSSNNSSSSNLESS